MTDKSLQHSTRREKLRQFVEGTWFQGVVIFMICANAITLGLETLPIPDVVKTVIGFSDHVFVFLFLLELVLRLMAHGARYFRSPWNVVDFFIIMGTVLASSSLFAALRAFRILRILRVVTAIPRMRTVVKALFDAVPGILSVAVVVTLVLYVFAVIAATLYGETNPELFGDIFVSMYTLFQIMTLEGWREIADAVQVEHQYAWVFFIIFVLIGTFTMLNLFIAIVVRVVEEESEDDIDARIPADTQMVLDELAVLNTKIERLEQSIRQKDQ